MLRTLLLSALALTLPLAAAPTKRTEILWDRFGIPHIYAKDHPSLFYAYGYAQMEAHAELLTRLYVQARGRGAEFYGSGARSSSRSGDESFVDVDRWVRRNGIPERAKLWASQQSPEFAPLLEAFADGLNGWAREHHDQLSEPARAALPFTPADVLGHIMRVIHFDWIASPLKVNQMVRLGNTGEVHGSNGWALAPSRTTSGKAMLISNSHLQWADLHTYFEVHLVAPGVNSSGAVWVGFPTLRLCFNDHLGWSQTTNTFDGADLYRLTLRDGGYVLDGKVLPFKLDQQTIRIRQSDGSFKEEPLTVKSSVHGPVVVERDGLTAALRVTALDRPRLAEQLWKMGLAQNLDQFQAAMRDLQLPLFNTTYADRDGHILYLFNAAIPKRSTGDTKFWSGLIQGDRSSLIWDRIHPYEDLPKVIDPKAGFVQNANDPPWTSAYPMLLDPAKFPAYAAPPTGITSRAQRSIRILSRPEKFSFEDLKAAKLSTHVETADQFKADLVAHAKQLGSARAKLAADILAAWDGDTENTSDGALLFYYFVMSAGPGFRSIGGYAVPTDERQPLTTPRGFADPAKAVAALDAAAGKLEAEYGSLHVKWGDAIRLRRGALDLPANGAPSVLGAIRTVNIGPFVQGKAEGVHGDSYHAVVEFANPVRAEALLTYGNWSRAGSKHIEDQLPLMSKKQMRPVWRARKDIEANLESRKVF
ncbi:MAG: penicillin acylase family protein [Acidobacteria bacterium]|nr:penicillin acylase family protein [Acidobacteriota bacterium]